MAITLKEAFAKNGTPDLTCFSALQAACKNPGYFNDSRPINRLSSWEGYYYYEGETIYQTTISLSDSAPSCFAGSVTATIYTYRKDKNTSGEWTDWYLYTGGTPSLSDNVDWLSCGSVSNNNTGTYSATISFDCNCKTTSTRNCSISASANGTSASVWLTQGADSYSESGGGTTYEYGSWGGGTISFNSTSNLSCGADSRTVYIQPWTRTVTTVVAPKYWDWVCGGRETVLSGSRSPWTDYYTGTVTLSENGSYTSLNTTSYTASSSAKSVTLSKSSCNYDNVGATTITVSASGATSTSASIGQSANTINNGTEYRISGFSINPTSSTYVQGSFTASYSIQKRSYTTSCANSTPSYGSWVAASGVKPSISSNSSWCRVGSIGSTNSSGNGSVVCSYDENTGSARNCVITCSYGTSATATFNQDSAPNIIVNITNGVRSWLGINIDVFDRNWNTVNLATGDHNSSTSDGIVPVGTFNNWTSLQQNTTSWPANIYFRDYDTLGNASSSFTATFRLYDANGQEVDTSKPISGNCNNHIDTTIEWIVGRDSNSDIAKMEIEISFS